MVSQSQRIDNLSGTTIQNPTITGGSITASSIAGTIANAINSAAATIDDLTSTTITATNATFTNATTTNLTATTASLTTASTTNLTTTNFTVTSTGTSTFAGGITAARVNATATSSLSGAIIDSGLQLSTTNCSSYGNGGKLTTDALGLVVCASDQGGSGFTVGGADTQIQFNSNGAFTGSAFFTFASTTQKLTVTNASTTNLTAAYASTTLATIGTLTLASALTTTNGGTGTSTPASANNLLSWNGTNYQGVATSSLFNLASAASSGIISAGDWSRFNTATTTASSPLTYSAATNSFTVQAASGSQNGYLSSGDYSLIHTATTTFSAPLTYTASTNAVTLDTSGSWSGNAGSATKLQTARAINGVSFDGTAPITITAASSTFLTDPHVFTALNTFSNATSTLFTSTTGWINTLNLTNALSTLNGGTGTSTPATANNLLSWNGTNYQGVATSSLFNIAASGVTGLLSGTDWNTFNGKQAAGNYLTALTGDVTASGPGSAAATLAMTVTHWWTALQEFGNASTSMLTATSTVWLTNLATPAGTFLAVDNNGKIIATSSPSSISTPVSIAQGGTATSTGGNTNGIFYYDGTKHTNSSLLTFDGSNLMIGTSTSQAPFTVFKTAASAQERISYDATRYAELYTDASGALNLTTTGTILNMLNGNMYLCDGGACPTTPVQGYPTFSSQGNLVLGNILYAAGMMPVTCPTGMIPVPPSPADGQQGFCVDKYIASQNGALAQSTAAGVPWVSITQYAARAACIAAGKHLITDREWLAIAHSIENVTSNWPTGVVGTLNGSSQGLPDGLSNFGSGAVSASSAGACSGSVTANTQNCTTGGGTWYDDMREQKLSNGQTIWDFGSNVYEWESDDEVNGAPLNDVTPSATCTTATCGNVYATNDQWVYSNSNAATSGFVRGGSWTDGANVGAFALNLNSSPSTANTHIGFRCAR